MPADRQHPKALIDKRYDHQLDIQMGLQFESSRSSHGRIDVISGPAIICHFTGKSICGFNTRMSLVFDIMSPAKNETLSTNLRELPSSMRTWLRGYQPLQSQDPHNANGDTNSWRTRDFGGTRHETWLTSLSLYQPLDNRLLAIIAILQAIGILVSLGYLWRFLSVTDSISPFPQLLYSPAQEVIRYKLQKFNDGFPGPDLPIYAQPSSKEVDRAWHNLTKHAYSRIPKESASRLPNRTLPIPGDPDGYYMAGVDVFHQLHCLDLLRRGLDREYYPWPYDYVGWVAGVGHIDWGQHLSHCIDSIRQSLMCTVDTSVGEMHTCRNFDDIWTWARDNDAKRDFNMTIHIQDDLEFPVLYQ